MYTSKNFKTKKYFRVAVESGERVTLWQPGPFGGGDLESGSFSVEGPHYPKPHKWYARVEVKGGQVVRVR